MIAADGAGFDGLTVDGALDRVRGPKGTKVALTVRRGEDDPFVLEITRDVIQQREVRSELLEGNVGYIRLAGFSDASAAQLEDEIRKHLDAGSKKLILDLRGNPAATSRRRATSPASSSPMVSCSTRRTRRVIRSRPTRCPAASPRTPRSSSSS